MILLRQSKKGDPKNEKCNYKTQQTLYICIF
mgnify:CR=1 FL=1